MNENTLKKQADLEMPLLYRKTNEMINLRFHRQERSP